MLKFSDFSDFNKLKKLDFLKKIEVKNSYIVLGSIEIAKFSNLLKSLASELLGRSKNFRIKGCRGFSCFQFECFFRQIGRSELKKHQSNYEN